MSMPFGFYMRFVRGVKSIDSPRPTPDIESSDSIGGATLYTLRMWVRLMIVSAKGIVLSTSPLRATVLPRRALLGYGLRSSLVILS